MQDLARHVKNTHKISKEEFIKMYPDQKLMTDELLLKRKKQLDQGRETCKSDPEVASRKSESNRKAMISRRSDSNNHKYFKELASKGGKAAMKLRLADPNYSSKQSEIVKSQWKNQEYRDMMVRRTTERNESGELSYGKVRKRIEHTTWYGKLIYLRSSYEKRFIEALDDLRINYNYEPMRLYYRDKEGKLVGCLPDIYLPDTNYIIEIKPSNLIPDKYVERIKSFIDKGYKADIVTECIIFDESKLYEYINKVSSIKDKSSTTILK